MSYPNVQDGVKAEVRGVSPGGAIMIHGQKNELGWVGPFMQRFDWSNGCIAVEREVIDRICAAVDGSAPIQIDP